MARARVVVRLPARREAVQRHVPTVHGVNVAHEWFHEPDVRRIHDFGDLMPLPDLQWLGV